MSSLMSFGLNLFFFLILSCILFSSVTVPVSSNCPYDLHCGCSCTYACCFVPQCCCCCNCVPGQTQSSPFPSIASYFVQTANQYITNSESIYENTIDNIENSYNEKLDSIKGDLALVADGIDTLSTYGPIIGVIAGDAALISLGIVGAPVLSAGIAISFGLAAASTLKSGVKSFINNPLNGLSHQLQSFQEDLTDPQTDLQTDSNADTTSQSQSQFQFQSLFNNRLSGSDSLIKSVTLSLSQMPQSSNATVTNVTGSRYSVFYNYMNNGSILVSVNRNYTVLAVYYFTPTITNVNTHQSIDPSMFNFSSVPLSLSVSLNITATALTPNHGHAVCGRNTFKLIYLLIGILGYDLLWSIMF